MHSLPLYLAHLISKLKKNLFLRAKLFKETKENAFHLFKEES